MNTRHYQETQNISFIKPLCDRWATGSYNTSDAKQISNFIFLTVFTVVLLYSHGSKPQNRS